MPAKTKLAIVAAALLAFASSAIAAPTHHLRRSADGYTNADRVYSTYSDPYCTSCNLGSY